MILFSCLTSCPSEGVSIAGLAKTFSFASVAQRNLEVFEAAVVKNSLTIGPDLELYAIAIIRSLQFLGRTPFVTVLHPLTSTGFQAGGLIKYMENFFPGTRVEAIPIKEKEEDMDDIVKNLERVKAVGYRTIILSLEFPSRGLRNVAMAANQVGLTNGEYVWILYGDFNQVFLDDVDKDPEVAELLKGSI